MISPTNEKLLIEETDKPVLYHYTSALALYSIFEKEKLWITQSDFLNDYMEKSYSEEMFQYVIKDIRHESPETHTFFDELEKQREHISSLSNAEYILSLTENPDSLSLWSNYSKHDGYNIGFYTSDLTLNGFNIGVSGNYIAHDYLAQHGRVIYDRELQKEIIYKELKIAFAKWVRTKEAYKDMNGDFEANDISATNTRLDIYSLFFKHPSFATEEEYRVVYIPRGSNVKNQWVNFRVSNGVIVPYVEIPLKNNTNDKGGSIPLHSVTIGPKNNLDTAVKGVRTYLKHAQYPSDIKVYKSDIPLRF